jgi:hypothetical protein
VHIFSLSKTYFNKVSIFDYTEANGKITLKNKLERMQKEAVVTKLRYYAGICLERMSKITKKSIRVIGVLAKI